MLKDTFVHLLFSVCQLPGGFFWWLRWYHDRQWRKIKKIENKNNPSQTHTQFFPSWTLLFTEDYYNNFFSIFHSISQIGHLLKILIFVPSMMTILCLAEIPLIAIKHNINYRYQLLRAYSQQTMFSFMCVSLSDSWIW